MTEVCVEMTKTEALNKLFDCWQQKVNAEGERFSADGIVEDEKYSNARWRCLFLLKEPNDHGDDIREHARIAASNPGHRIRQYLTWGNLARWSYGLLHDFAEFDAIENAWESLLEVAVMNLKKTPGLAAANSASLAAFARHPGNRDFIIEELRIIEPQVIICCGRPVWELLREVVGENLTNDVGNDCFTHDGIPILAHYHPAYWAPGPRRLYEPLMTALRRALVNPDPNR